MNVREYLSDWRVLAVLGWAVFSVGVYVFTTELRSNLINLTYIPFDGSEILCAVIVAYMFIFYGWSNFEGKVWFLLAVGIAFWTAGELVSMVYNLWWDNPALGENADYLYLIGYGLLIIGFIYKAKYAKIHFDPLKIGAILAVVAVLGVVSIVISADPILEDTGAVDERGDVLDEPPYFSFTTAVEDAPANATAMAASEEGASDVSVHASVVLADIQPDADRASVMEYFTLYDPDGEPVPGAASWNGSVMVFTPSAPLLPNATYTAEVYTGLSEFNKVIGVAYIVLDLVLLGLGLVVALYWGMGISPGWYLISASMVFMWLADLSYPAMVFTGVYYDGSYMELLYIACFLSFALGALYQWKLHRDMI